jgi:flagellar hook assembly protein FlgD
MNQAVETISKQNEKSMVSYVKNVVAKTIIGSKTNGSGSVNNVVSVRRFEVGRLWKIVIYPF